MYIVNGQQLRAYHGANLILDGVDFEIHEGEKAGLIGRNGSGKTTLLKLIARQNTPDEGLLTHKKDIRIGYLPQIPEEFEAMTVHEVLAYGYRELQECHRQMSWLEQEMSDPDAAATERMEKLLKSYAALQERFEQAGGYEMEANINQVANGLHIPESAYKRIFGSLSGGEKTRIALASQLIGKPDLLLLDEPTNHLDLKGLEWLEQFLRSYAGACVIVSHDRYFLDAVIGKVIEIEDGEAHTYLTHYSGYLKEKEERLLIQFADYQEQQKRIKKMKEAIRRFEEWGRIGDNEKFFKKAASIRKALERMELIKRPVLERQSADFDLNPQDRSGRKVVRFENLHKAYAGRPILAGAEGSLEFGEKVALLGDNGAGKSTLLRLLLGNEQPDVGHVEWGSRVEYGYLAQQEEREELSDTVLTFFRKEAAVEEGEARGILARYLFYGADVFKPVRMLSGGEWSRLRLALLVMKKPNLLLLDEPTNHLDIDSREALEEALEAFPGTVMVISHDRYFVNKLARRVWELENGRLTSYLGGFDDYREKKRQLEDICKVPEKREEVVVDKGKGTAGSKAENSNQALAAMEKLERRITAQEAALTALEAELEQATDDPVRLEELWNAREEQRERLDALLAEWIALE
ncbi:ATP-binding cassette domain-containing protein [Paenibacillus sp. P96]|uniref:ATP-binding cassette domain-containing protein n=1 Tax=Paenibacillus zeirhizosphaerae TaxID=2987519 RepID=A0ABT9FNH3_9BACL|nr:ATP-binding cassette domain-containing protein [Paenibacillus sp. P96]MDP4096234.1 ATP-binding cassette domain-containing protein [Paenibacillus sp. P96]